MSMHSIPQPVANSTSSLVSLPIELTSQRLFVVFELVPQAPKANGAPAKDKKIPFQAAAWLQGRKTTAKVDDPATFSTYEEAVQCVREGKGHAIGFRVPDGYTLADKDDVIVDGVISDDGLAFIETFRGTHTHVSMSGGGLHALCKGELPKARKLPEIELYCGSSTKRFCAVPVDPVGFSGDAIMDCQSVLDDLWERYGAPEAPVRDADPVMVSMDARDIIEKLRGQSTDVGRRLLDGDTAGYGGPSEARAALAWKACFYTDDAGAIAEVIRSSPLLDHHPQRDHQRRAMEDATKAIATYSGPRYDPTRGRIVERDPQFASDEMNQAAEYWKQRALKVEERYAAVTDVIAIDEMEPQTRMAVIGLMMVGFEFQDKGKKPTQYGHHMPASWIGRYCGMNEQAVNRQLKAAQKIKAIGTPEEPQVITREIVPLTREERETIFDEDGVIIGEETFKKRGSKAFYTFPDNVVDIVPHLTKVERPADAPKRGGARVPKCDKHPEAEVIRQSVYHCEACYAEAMRNGTRPPVLSVSDPVRAKRAEVDDETPLGIKHEGNIGTVSTGGIKHEPNSDTPTGFKLEANRASTGLAQQTPVSSTETIGRYCQHKTNGELCSKVTEDWDTGYGSDRYCHRHAEENRNRGYRAGVAS